MQTTLTEAQRSILVALDGRMTDVLFSARRWQALKTLQELGLIQYEKDSGFYSVRLTMLGGNFIYNGGID